MTVKENVQIPIDRSKAINLDDGLIMRWSTKADTDNVAELVGNCFRWLPLGDPHPENEIPGPHQLLMAGARRLLTGKTSVMSEFDYALVEDTNNHAKGKNPIIACVAFHQVPAHYGSVDLVFGKPELIATEPSYRNKGLIRRLLLEMVHPASEAKGNVLQFIPGIPYFYRQFGYDYGLQLFPSSKIESINHIPPLPATAKEPYHVREATLDDVSFLSSLSTQRHLQTQATVGTRYTREYWQYAVHDSFQDRQSRFDADRQNLIITGGPSGEKGSQKAIGFVSISHAFFGSQVEAIALDDNINYVDVGYSVVRQLFAFVAERQARNTKAFEEFKKAQEKERKQQQGISDNTDSSESNIEDAPASTKPTPPPSLVLNLHPTHPLCVFLGSKVKPVSDLPGFRIYTRINSYPRFLTAVRPELERRLAENPATRGISCQLRLDFFRKVEGNVSKGLEIVIDRGALVKIEDWAKPSPEELFSERMAWNAKEKSTNGAFKAPSVYYGTFAPLTFTQLVTGKQSLEELIWSFGETLVRDETGRVVLNTLFPKVIHSMDIFNW
ncbi:hypothetical protein FBU30_008558 [Linnemannia zychae]|nr:hypothetical protein FBU30_008558 [Linnemannia zychae]